MKQTDPHFKIRLPPELKDLIAEAAKSNNRSMNAEIVSRLTGSFGSNTVASRNGASDTDIDVTVSLNPPFLGSEQEWDQSDPKELLNQWKNWLSRHSPNKLGRPRVLITYLVEGNAERDYFVDLGLTNKNDEGAKPSPNNAQPLHHGAQAGAKVSRKPPRSEPSQSPMTKEASPPAPNPPVKRLAPRRRSNLPKPG